MRNADTRTLNVLFIDNFDSFVFNLVDEFRKRDCHVEVWRNDISPEGALEVLNKMPSPKMVVLSPGPGTPEDAGCCLQLLRTAPVNLPIFGVCLGHQSIVAALGGEVVQAGEIVHGKSSIITHSGDDPLFKGLNSPLSVGRYHSLITRPDSNRFTITAQLGEMVMAVTHKERPVAGVQFHPESILTPDGGRLIDNVISWAKDKGQ